MAAIKAAEQVASPPRTTSIFREDGLVHTNTPGRPDKGQRPVRQLRFRSKPDVFIYSDETGGTDDGMNVSEKDAVGTREQVATTKHVKSSATSDQTLKATRTTSDSRPGLYRYSVIALVLAILLPVLHGFKRGPWFGHASVPAMGVDGGVVMRNPNPVIDVEPAPRTFTRRADSPTDVCTRWAHQSALVNGTLYIYGGQATTTYGQTENTWNNDFLTLDLTSTWQVSSPSLTGLPQPSGPPNVALGSLWYSHTSLYLYGGEFSDAPVESPTAFSLWEYDLLASDWIEHSSPMTSAGNNTESSGQSVQRAAEGAGFSVPALGRGWYFGGHQDGYTTEGWSQSVWRIYLKSILEFTFPGAQNSQVTSLGASGTAGTDGVWRNITNGGSQDANGFPERADGVLVYVPGFGATGILIGLAGGTNETYQQMNEVDVYDVATSTWYKQATSGSTPEIRVNPCAVVAAAPDGSSYNVYMYGGQSLLPYDNQTQYNDMWILTIPSFTWISVDTSGQSVPYARAGHTCNIWDGQMVVVGGYVGTQLSCDSPGIYVFDTSALKWVESFTALSGASTSDANPSASTTASSAASTSSLAFISNSKTNPFNQQPAQLANVSDPGGLEGSYGYHVPAAVISIVGGASTGGATVTAPAQTATNGPLATGSAITYTVTNSAGATTTETGVAGPDSSGSSSSSSSNGSSKPNIAAIVAGIIAGLLFVLVCYLAFCGVVYRKRLALYKQHVEMSQRVARGEKTRSIADFVALAGSGDLASSSLIGGSGGLKNSLESGSAHGSGARSGASGGSGNGVAGPGVGFGGAAGGYASVRRASSDSASDVGLLGGQEPSFWGTMLAPRRSLRIVNRD